MNDNCIMFLLEYINQNITYKKNGRVKVVKIRNEMNVLKQQYPEAEIYKSLQFMYDNHLIGLTAHKNKPINYHIASITPKGHKLLDASDNHSLFKEILRSFANGFGSGLGQAAANKIIG